MYLAMEHMELPGDMLFLSCCKLRNELSRASISYARFLHKKLFPPVKHNRYNNLRHIIRLKADGVALFLFSSHFSHIQILCVTASIHPASAHRPGVYSACRSLGSGLYRRLLQTRSDRNHTHKHFSNCISSFLCNHGSVGAFSARCRALRSLARILARSRRSARISSSICAISSANRRSSAAS